MTQEVRMYTKLKESVFYQSRLKKCKAELEENGKDIKKKQVMDQLSCPDAIWHRSKTARFRLN